MQKIYFSKVRRMVAAMALCVVAISAQATPYKNIHVQLVANETGRGVVYMKTEDPSNQQTRKGETATLKATIGENGNDLTREEGDPLRGFYMVGLFGEAEEGYELAGFSLVKKADNEYTKADLLVAPTTDSNGWTDPYVADGGLVFNANCSRDVDAQTDENKGYTSDMAREDARAKDNWNVEPDHVVYAVFLPEGTVLPDGDNPDKINNVVRQTSKAQVFTLSGQKVTSMRKGIYIINGKKVIK
ncbi:hypothetical protein [Xylanibacter brevis]|uniref:hypothetical protein n=1 Tax=Xylanibacter brevis TaxID=83231 RepID=UPI0012DC26EA|nr:hypothetical protein [Xylanibacter brevis]